MANRSFHPPRGSLELETIALFGSLTIGAAGAVSASSGKGISSIVRLSAGRYQINLQDNYNSLLYVDAVSLNNSPVDSTTAGSRLQIALNAVNSATAPSITIQFSIVNGTATDPAVGAQFLIRLDLKNSSVV